jgi:hypothetical protein
MKNKPMSKYIISILLLLGSFSLSGQENTQENDTVTYKDRYGFRLGIDVVRPIVSLFDEDRTGLELVGDYRVSKRFYIAAELGYREYTDQEDFYNYSTKGQYIKAGVDYNAYKNWLGMENMIVVGLRYAFSTFDQTVNYYTINADPFLPEETVDGPINYDGLNGQWLELVLGLKVEVLRNLFLGFSFRGNTLISAKEPDNFKNLYIPGFERVFVNDFGFSFNYTVSYLIPFYRK